MSSPIDCIPSSSGECTVFLCNSHAWGWKGETFFFSCLSLHLELCKNAKFSVSRIAVVLEGKHLNPFPLLVRKMLLEPAASHPRNGRESHIFACAEVLIAKLLLFQKKSALLTRVWATLPNPLPVFSRWIWWLFFSLSSPSLKMS